MLPLPTDHPAHPLQTLQWPDPPPCPPMHRDPGTAFKNPLGPIDALGPTIVIVGLVILYFMGSGK